MSTNSFKERFLLTNISYLLLGLLPACFTKQSRRQWPLLLSCLLCFGGGVLLSTSIVHILPEAKEEVRQSFKPYIELFFCTGFFLLYLMDEIVHFFFGEVARHSHQSASQNGHTHYHNNTERRIDFIERFLYCCSFWIYILIWLLLQTYWYRICA